MSDKTAKAAAAKIRAEFWTKYEWALAPKVCSKQAYKDELEELVCDAESRLDCIREELAAEAK